jgi:hypothetical protein
MKKKLQSLVNVGCETEHVQKLDHDDESVGREGLQREHQDAIIMYSEQALLLQIPSSPIPFVHIRRFPSYSPY